MNRRIFVGTWGKGIVVATLSSLCLGSSLSAARKAGRGGESYRRGDYEGALKSYSEALADAPEKPQLYFNIGDVLYRQEKFPEAARLFEKSAAPGDPALQAKSWYNIGNAKYRDAVREAGRKTPGGAAGGGGDADALREAAACYVRSLELDPGDLDAKYNLEFVQRILQQQERQKQQEEENKKDEEQEEKDQQEREDEDAEDTPPEFGYGDAPDKE